MDKTVEKLKNIFENEEILKDYRSIPFWSWNNSLDEEYLTHQIEEMKRIGIGGFIMHARTGLKDEYLGEKWFSCVDACLKKAKELKMNAWIYDENGWPSGFVGGKLLENEDYRARYLECEIKDSYDEKSFCVFKKTESGFKRVYGDDGSKEYYCVYLRISPANTDILNEEVVDEFIRLTHEEYYKRFKDSFGKELVGFFTDEPQYYRWGTPYTPAAEKYFKEKYGEDVKDGLIYLFYPQEKGYLFNNRYYRALNDLYVHVFYKKIYDWCEEHNCKLTGHSVEEGGLSYQMWGGAAVMPSYEYEHIPGVDALGRYCSNDIAPKQVGSVASQLGKKQVLTETFGCSGNDVTPQELKTIAEWQFFNGVNLMCQQLLPISIAAQGKDDHPPVFSAHGNWWEQGKVFYDHFARLGYIVANTTETYDVAVVHPMRNIYLDYTRFGANEECVKLEQAFYALIDEMRQKGVRYQLLDETLLAKYGKIKSDGSLVCGKCTYDKIIVPNMKSVAKSTLELLKEFGGKLAVLGKLEFVDGVKERVELKANCTLEDIIAERKIKFSCKDVNSFITSREGDIGKFLFIANKSLTESSEIELSGVANEYSALNLETLELSPIAEKITLEKCESLILLKVDGSFVKDTEKIFTKDVTKDFCVKFITENFLVLDYASYSLDGVKYSDNQPIPRLFEELLRLDYKGKVYIRHTFEAKDKIRAKLVIEDNRFEFIRLNGNDLTLEKSEFDTFFKEADISEYIQEGKNTLLYCVDYYQHDGVYFALFDPLATESLRNCLYYDTHIENCFVKGDFIVDKDRKIAKKESAVPLTKRLYENGYPYFKGVLTLKGKYVYDGNGKRTLNLGDGRFLVAEVFVNGKKTEFVLDTKADITGLLICGENKIEIKLHSSLRNLFGPHHFKPNKEPMSVSPYNFTFRGCWNGKVADDYTDEYNVVPFGLDSIKVTEIY